MAPLSELESMITKFGTLLSLEDDEVKPAMSQENQTAESSTSSNSRSITAVFQSREEAERAVTELNVAEIGGEKLHAKIVEKRHTKRPTGGPNNGYGGMLGVGGLGMGQRQIDFPLRILVESEMVGAIIGRGGQTIRQITQQTRYGRDSKKMKKLDRISVINQFRFDLIELG